MADSVFVAAFEGGNLRLCPEDASGREVVLGLPASRMLVRMVRVPAESAEDPAAAATPVLQEMNPFPDEPLTVGCEKVHDYPDGSVAVIAAALPESSADDIAEALDAHKINVMRIDLLELGLLRGIWSGLGESENRRLLLFGGADGITLFALDGDRPSAVRAFARGADVVRETTLSLLEAENFGGPRPLGEIVAVGDVQTEGLEKFGSVRRLEVGEDVALDGIAARSADAGALDALPAGWREVLAETRFKAKLVRRVAVAGVIWAMLAGVIFGMPAVYGYMTDRQKSQIRRHHRQYEEVAAIKAKLDTIRKYSDHSRGALEIMKAVSDRLPTEGVTLSDWVFKADEGVSLMGQAESKELVYEFKDRMVALADSKGDKVFRKVDMGSLSESKNSELRWRFKLTCGYETDEEEQ